jgi:hypothetical protein
MRAELPQLLSYNFLGQKANRNALNFVKGKKVKAII